MELHDVRFNQYVQATKKKGNIEEGKKFEGFMSQQVSKGDKKVGKVRTACTSIE